MAERLKRRLELHEKERFISARPPRIRGGMLVIPRGLLLARATAEQRAPLANGFSDDPAARRQIEAAAIAAVMATERALGNIPTDVSAEKVGYDILSYDPRVDHQRFIEVKGRVAGADTVMITRQEIITSLHEPKKFVLARVEVDNGFARSPIYVRGALDTRKPPFEHNAVQFSLKRLRARGEDSK